MAQQMTSGDHFWNELVDNEALVWAIENSYKKLTIKKHKYHNLVKSQN